MMNIDITKASSQEFLSWMQTSTQQFIIMYN